MRGQVGELKHRAAHVSLFTGIEIVIPVPMRAFTLSFCVNGPIFFTQTESFSLFVHST